MAGAGVGSAVVGCAVATGTFPVATPCGKAPGVPGAAIGTGGTGCVPGAGGWGGFSGAPCCKRRKMSVAVDNTCCI